MLLFQEVPCRANHFVIGRGDYKMRFLLPFHLICDYSLATTPIFTKGSGHRWFSTGAHAVSDTAIGGCKPCALGGFLPDFCQERKAETFFLWEKHSFYGIIKQWIIHKARRPAMKKRFLSLLCILAFALPFVAATPCFADTGETTIGQITYQHDTETDEAMVTHADSGISGDVEIPGTIEVGDQKYKVTSIGDHAFSGCSSLTQITIPEGVTSIGDYAFSECSSLTQIAIPESVTSIGYGTFDSCSSLKEITIPEGVTSIGYGTFAKCSSLTEITIPEGVTSIGDYAFTDCSSLKEITIPEGVTSIGEGTFAYCSSLTQITIPEGVTSIGDGAFYDCSSLTQITIPEGVTSIGDDAFYGCVNLTNVYVREGLSLGTDSFLYVSQGAHVWCYEVLKNAEASEDGKVHVAIVSVEDKDGADITASLAISDGAMGDGYVIDEVKPSNLTLKHTLTETGATSATCTEPGNVEYWTCDACGKHFIDENGTNEITAEDTMLKAIGHSYENGKCTVCSEVDPAFKAMIIEGANGKWQKGSEGGLSFTSNAAFADFQKVQVDGNDVDSSNYTVKEGSTVVTLNASYLETLSAGKHTLAIVSDTGTAETEFTVVAAEKQVVDDESANDKAASDGDKESLAKTGDDSMLPITVLSILAVVSIATGVFALRRSRI